MTFQERNKSTFDLVNRLLFRLLHINGLDIVTNSSSSSIIIVGVVHHIRSPYLLYVCVCMPVLYIVGHKTNDKNCVLAINYLKGEHTEHILVSKYKN
jgi:hypothetical protein